MMKLWTKSHSIGYPTLKKLAAAITCGGFYLPSLPPRSKIDVREPATWSLVEARPFCSAVLHLQLHDSPLPSL